MNKINRVTALSWMLIALVITGCTKTEKPTIKAYIDKNVEYAEAIEFSDSLEITNVSVCYQFKNNDGCQSISFQSDEIEELHNQVPRSMIENITYRDYGCTVSQNFTINTKNLSDDELIEYLTKIEFHTFCGSKEDKIQATAPQKLDRNHIIFVK